MSSNTLVFNFIGRDSASAAMHHIAAGMDTLGAKTKAFAKFAGMALIGAGTAMAGLGAAGIVLGVKTAAGLEQAQIGFATMLKSGQKAKVFLDQLKSFAAATPFELKGLVDSSRLLIGVGLNTKQTMGVLKTFGDTAAAVGIDGDHFNSVMLALSQSIAAGHIKLGDMNQLMNNGLPIWKLLSEAIGKPVPKIQEMISKGQLLTKDVLPKLEVQMHKDYGGAMAKQSQTLNGLWSTFTDTLSLGLASAIQPMIPALKTGLTNATATAGKALQKIPAIVQAMTKDFKTAKTYITGTLVPALKTAFGGIGASLPSIDVSGMGKTFAAEATKWGGLIIGGVKVGLKTGDWSGLGSTIGDGLSRALIGGGKLIDIFGKWFASVDWLNVGKSVGKTVAPFVLGLSLTLIDGLMDAFKKHPGEVLFALATIIPVGKILTAFKPARAVLEALPFGKWIATAFDHSAAPAFDGAWTFIKFVGRGIAKGFSEVFPSTSGFIGRLGRSAGTWLRLNASALSRAAIDMIEGISKGIGRALGNVLLAIGRLIARILRPFAPAARWLIGAGRDLVSGLISGIGRMFGSLGTTISTVISRVRAPFGRAVGWLFQAGRQVMSGLFQGMLDGARSAGRFVSSAGGAVVREVRRFFGIRSPSTVFRSMGVQLMAGLFSGMIQQNPVKTITKIFGGMPQALGALVSKGLVKIGDLPGKALGALGKLGGKFAGLLGGLGGGGSVKIGGLSPAESWIIMHESGNRTTAANPTSTAFGLGQLLLANRQHYGQILGVSSATTNYASQLAMFRMYVRDRYGTAERAQAFWKAHHWYGSGGVVSRPSLVGVGEKGPERILSAAQTRSFDRLVRVMDRGGSGAGGGLTLTINATGSDIELENKIVRVVTNARRHGRLS